MEITDTIEQWGSIPDAELPAASMLAVLEGLERKKRPEAMADQALVMVRRYPHSRYTLTALCKTIRMFRDPERTTQASTLKAILSHDYPNSIPALSIEIETAFHQGDLPRMRCLLTDYSARVKVAGSANPSEQDPGNADSIAYWLSHCDYRFDGKISQEVLENYLSRAIWADDVTK